jgi:hypothetical protein
MPQVIDKSEAAGPAEGAIHLDDYYQLLNVRPGFTELQLLRRFLTTCRKAMDTNDMAEVMRIRKGFEVLRYEDTRISYFRMYQLLVRKEPLRFPINKQREMLQEIQTKQALATSTSPVVEEGTSYFQLELKVIAGILLEDLARIFVVGMSGIVLLIGILILITANNASLLSLGISIPMGVLAIYMLTVRATDYVTYPEVL